MNMYVDNPGVIPGRYLEYINNKLVFGLGVFSSVLAKQILLEIICI